jgi:hypothetical protein
MKEKPLPSHDNPSDELAAQLDEILSAGTNSDAKTGGDEGIVAGHVTMQQSTARTVRASAVAMDDSAVGFIRTGAVEAQKSVIGWMLAREAQLKDVSASVVAANHLQAKEVTAFAVLAGRIDGQVKATLTPQAAFAAGAGFAAVILLVGRLLTGRGDKQK